MVEIALAVVKQGSIIWTQLQPFPSFSPLSHCNLIPSKHLCGGIDQLEHEINHGQNNKKTCPKLNSDLSKDFYSSSLFLHVISKHLEYL